MGFGHIKILDGANTIGGTKIYLEQEDEGLFLDFGLNFNRYGKFFQEFLNPRTSRGIYDLIKLDLIPKLNIYRKNLIPSDLNISSYPSLNVKGVLLSHAHMDHYGNIGLLKRDIPVIGSPKTISLLKGIRDCSRPRFYSEAAYFSNRVPSDDDRCIKSDQTKSGKYIGRNFIATNTIKSPFQDFFRRNKSSRKDYEWGEVKELCDYSCKFNIRPFEVDHSIPGATGYKLEGDLTITYTGDFRLHGSHADKTKAFFKNAKDTSILIIEGTRASREEHEEEKDPDLFKNCVAIAEQANDLIIADFAGRNFERLKMFQNVATKVGRILVIPAKTAYLLNALEKTDEIDRLKDLRVYSDLRVKKNSWEENILKYNHKITYIDPSKISKDPENYIIAFTFYSIKNLLDIRPESGLYIYSSSEAFGEESEFDFIRLKNWLDYLNIETYGFDIDVEEGKPIFDKKFHISGHASKSDLRWAINTVDPDVIIPVHTENPDWFKHSFDNAHILKNGNIFKF